MNDPIAIAEMTASMATVLDLMEGLVRDAMRRGYTEEQARQVVVHLLTRASAESPA